MPAALLNTFRRVAGALKEADIPFVLGGGLAAWAHGGPITEHDVDLFVAEGNSQLALNALADAGMRTEHPPEGWLVKAWDAEIQVDLIFRPIGLDIDAELIESCPVLDVHAVPVRVLQVEDILVTKLLALTEHHLDYAPVLACARSLREQIYWHTFAQRISPSPFARTFLFLVRELGICPAGVSVPHQPIVAQV
jgi:predicted nucleotidyltransferase